MSRIVSIVPATAGWYARWRFASDLTRSLPVTVWALVEDATASDRQVVGVDAGGQWPGASNNQPGAEFVGYVYQPAGDAPPDDVFNPLTTPAESA